MVTWEAHYPGTCGDCDDPIRVGQLIRRHPTQDGEYVHATCPDPLPAASGGVCTHCWQAFAANGTCACD